MFQLTADEKQEVIANCDNLEKIKFSRTNPYAFTEHGTIMLANVLNTPTAVETSIRQRKGIEAYSFAILKLQKLLSSSHETI